MIGRKPKSPLTNHFGENFGGSKPRRKRVFIGAALLLIVPYIGSTLAASVTITGSGGSTAIEFGQGSQATIACDTSVNTSISQTWYQTSTYFRVSTISLTNLNNASSSTLDGGCGTKKIKLQLLNSSGTALTIGTSDNTSVTITIPTSNNNITDATLYGNTAALTNEGATSTVTITIPSTTAINAGDVYRITLETLT
jgi:hypothetical protein